MNSQNKEKPMIFVSAPPEDPLMEGGPKEEGEGEEGSGGKQELREGEGDQRGNPGGESKRDNWKKSEEAMFYSQIMEGLKCSNLNELFENLHTVN